MFFQVKTTEGKYSGEAMGAPKGRALSEPQLQPTPVITTASFATLAVDTQQGRQASPDIQDIITGIVKLLNGNVNVQANTAPAMGRPLRPISTRINNRGPPRITDVPALPPDFDSGPLPPPLPVSQLPHSPSSTRMPTPYPFDIPPLNTSPVKPFINGVPLPEQLVPSGFPGIRRPPNIPPWKRPQRRPPPRRPMPYNPYKPLPPHYQENLPSSEDPQMFSNSSQDILTLNFGSDVQIIPITDDPELENQTDVESNETASEITDESSQSEVVPEKTYKDKDIPEKKKDKNSQKMEKHQSKYNIIVNISSEVNEKSIISSSTSTVVQPTVEVLKNDSNGNETVENVTVMEGIGEATPVLDTSIMDIVSSGVVNENTSISSSSTPTESLPTMSSTLLDGSITESAIETTSTASSSKHTGKHKFVKICILCATHKNLVKIEINTY